ncbi:MAG: DUF2807 domain-containing protein, partial [Acidobacteria bacterium]|nr:DUF2807 domain-containing protein [Acidobacteriota bacterium]
MKKIGFLIFLGVLAVGFVAASASSFGKLDTGGLFKFNFGGVRGSGNVITQKRDVSGFHAIEVGNTIQVDVVAQKDFSVTIETDDNIAPLIETEVENGVLEISCEKHISSSSAIRVHITAPDIDKVDASGVAKVSVAGVKGPSFSADVSGVSQ